MRRDFKVGKLLLPYEQMKGFRYEKLTLGILIHKCNGIPIVQIITHGFRYTTD